MLTSTEATIFVAARNMLRDHGARRPSLRQGAFAQVAAEALSNYLVTLHVYDEDAEASKVLGLEPYKLEPEPEPEPAAS